jgi:hypothetical protein
MTSCEQVCFAVIIEHRTTSIQISYTTKDIQYPVYVSFES